MKFPIILQKWASFVLFSDEPETYINISGVFQSLWLLSYRLSLVNYCVPHKLTPESFLLDLTSTEHFCSLVWQDVPGSSSVLPASTPGSENDWFLLLRDGILRPQCRHQGCSLLLDWELFLGLFGGKKKFTLDALY